MKQPIAEPELLSGVYFEKSAGVGPETVLISHGKRVGRPYQPPRQAKAHKKVKAGKGKTKFDFMVRKTKRILKEVQQSGL